jgi:hypothetical protein
MHIDGKLMAYLAVARDLIDVIDDCKESVVFNSPCIKDRISHLSASIDGLQDLVCTIMDGIKEISQD